MSVCLFAYRNLKTTWLNFSKFFVHVIYVYGSVLFWRFATCCVLTVLWMMSCFRTMGPMGRIEHYIMFRRSLLGVSTCWQIQCLVEFIWMWQWGRSLPSTVDLLVKVMVNGVYQFATSLTATGTHMPYWITKITVLRLMLWTRIAWKCTGTLGDGRRHIRKWSLAIANHQRG